LTEFQADWIRQGRTSELVVGQYRILHSLGSGRLGETCRAEHLYLRGAAVVRILDFSSRFSAQMMRQYLAELRALSRLKHANIVVPLDAGELLPGHTGTSARLYVVFDHVAGWSLERYVMHRGPLAAGMACDVVHQVACALTAAYEHGLAHRALRPSKVMLMSDQQIKLLDFGLTPPTADSRPEREAEADVFALGSLLYWCLTGHAPGCSVGRHPAIPARLGAIIARTRSTQPGERYTSAHAVVQALAPMVAAPEYRPVAAELLQGPPRAGGGARSVDLPHVLVVDDDPEIRRLCRTVLEPQGIRCDEAGSGVEALRLTASVAFDLILLDVAMPGMSGEAVCRELRANPPLANLKILMFSGHATGDDLAPLLAAGADDYLTKPISTVQLLARIKSALRLKEAEDRADEFHRHLLGTNYLLERNLHSRDQDLVEAHKALVLALAKLVECRDTETGAHIKRLQAYCRRLAEEAAGLPAFASLIDRDFIRWLEWCAPLHDIGKAGIPDAILQKAGPLDAEERRLIQTHTVLGADTLVEVARQHGSGMGFLQMAIDVARHHHERFDGRGYPDALAAHDIPLSARLVAIADVYDALRSRRVYKQPIPHDVAVQTILEESPGQFDPALLQVFARCAPDFERVFSEWRD
jgi:response regulator RpfG family c-di-GMP phosphodiesterase